MSEKEIDQAQLRLAQQGDRSAIVYILKQLESSLYRTAYYMLGNETDALDMTQEAFIRIYRSIQDFRGEAAISTWAQRIVSNICRDFLRKNKETFPLDERYINDGLKGVQEVGATVQLDLDQAILELPNLQRNIVVLRYVHDYSLQQIASTLEMPLNTVKSHLFRARKQLKMKLAEYRRGGRIDG
ncbi:RNA polymerase sigma-70 factor, ECF subfamily [Seinonella peptonophila]|uniref:RNA polymerase sigma-70 factor, ECF subfamily n=1 Tax=Seinonella peptonophila TaxID=112248 RepID=A0A1M4V9Q3_9BACL|nr:RNA polymerase sigma factor [Seinonella peptonophila]SHE65603.1 RNA polymerase sigma-70 factor, ECF subfamily [Seinonella peptonophila]